MSSNGIATGEDFKRAAEQANPPVQLVLPKCGLAVLARRLSPLRALMMGKKLDEIRRLDEPAGNVQRAILMLATIQEVLVAPRLSISPAANEIDPNWVPIEDGHFLFNWGLGLAADDGTSLTEFFRRERGPAAATGAGGVDVWDPAQPDAGPDEFRGPAI
jgi:hypothetical protein